MQTNNNHINNTEQNTMISKLISASGIHHLHPTHTHSQILSNNSQTTPFSTSHLSFFPKPSLLFPSTANCSSAASFKTRVAKVRAAAAGALYTETETKETFYDLLGISESGTLSEIKKAYKQLARKYHPDVSPPEQTKEYTKRFIMVQEAYETLSDPHTRASYDRDLSRGFHTAFSARRGSRYNNERSWGGGGTEEWKKRWESQIEELQRRSKNKERVGERMSWGDQMRSRKKTN